MLEIAVERRPGNARGGQYTHHIYTDYRGATAIKAMQTKAESLEVTIITSTAATHLLTSGDTVVGVQAQQGSKVVNFNAKAVVLATGFSCGNFDLMRSREARGRHTCHP